MSRKLGAFALVLAVLFCSMELKSVLTSTQQHGTVMVASGPDPIPPPKKSGSALTSTQHGAVLVASGPDPIPPPKKSGF